MINYQLVCTLYTVHVLESYANNNLFMPRLLLMQPGHLE